MKSWCSATRRRGGWILGQAVNARAPRRAVLRHPAPLLEVRWQARARQRLVQRVPERELRTPVRPLQKAKSSTRNIAKSVPLYAASANQLDELDATKKPKENGKKNKMK